MKEDEFVIFFNVGCSRFDVHREVIDRRRWKGKLLEVPLENGKNRGSGEG